MAADHLQFLKDKFINDFEEAVGEFNELPLILHFREIFEVLQQKRISFSTPIRTKDFLYDLKFALAECVMLAEKQREQKTQNKRSHYSVKELWFLFRTRQKLTHIKENLENLLPDTSDDPAAERPSSSSGSVRVSQPGDFPDFNGMEIHGFNDHLQKIEALLLETPATESIRSIGIVGMGGSGKTALAQMMFHSPRVQEIFSPMLWVELCDQFPNPQSIVSAIVESLASDELSSDCGSDYDDLDKLLHNMHRRLFNKKYLIVLDNVWNASDRDLDLNSNSNLQMGGGNNSFTTTRLWHGLPKGSGGAIIVTTRLEEVADKMVGELNLRLRLGPILDHESCWSIILDSVAKEISDHPKFLEMKDEMVERCDGLPLAAKTLAQIISTELGKLLRDAKFEKKLVLKLDLHDDKAKQKAMKAISGVAGAESIAMDMKEKKVTVIGTRDLDPVSVVAKLRRCWHTEIIHVGPAAIEPEKERGGA